MPKGEHLFTNNLKVTIEDYKVKEDAKEGFDIVVSFKLKLYREYSTVKYIINQETNYAEEVKERPITLEKQEEIPTETNPQSYTVVKGDNLWAICKRQYGDGSKYKEIAEKNNIANPNLIYPGQVIYLD